MKNDYEIRGEVTAIFIKRKDGSVLETIISTSDLEKAKEFPNTWTATLDPDIKTFYIQGYLKIAKNKYSGTRFHRWILDAPKGLVVDHIDHDTLNNTRKNLRILTNAQNQQNRKGAQVNSSSGVRGVHWHTQSDSWKARIKLNGKILYLGSFENIKDAEKAVIEARKKYMPFSMEV